MVEALKFRAFYVSIKVTMKCFISATFRSMRRVSHYVNAIISMLKFIESFHLQNTISCDDVLAGGERN